MMGWMTRHPVAANLLMITIVVGGLLVGRSIKTEVFPAFSADVVTVSVPYPGASPEEVERGIIVAIEENVRGIEGVDVVHATAREGLGTVSIELLEGVDTSRALSDVKGAVDRITSFPKEAERATVSLSQSRREVVSLVIYGHQSEHALRALAEQARDGLLAEPGITQVTLGGVRPPEIAVEVPTDRLRTLGLSLQGVARQVRDTSLELPGGGVRTASGEVLVRTTERRERGEDLANISVLSSSDGARVELAEVSHIDDGFRETDQRAFFDGKPAAMVKVYRTGDQTPSGVAKTVKAFTARFREGLAPGVEVAVWNDQSLLLAARIDLLLRNAWMGLALVMLVLGLFLDLRLAFWVMLGIPISFLGSLALMPVMGVSINMVSLFAFIVTLGMVVDDAIVIGENIFSKRQAGLPPVQAAIEGVTEMLAPVTFAILTTVAAFSPLIFLPGVVGKIFSLIPAIVVSVLVVSLVESFFILPNHLSHSKSGGAGHAVSRFLHRFLLGIYRPVLRLALRWRWTTLALGMGTLVLAVGFVAGGFIKFNFMPKVESDLVAASLSMPYGEPVAGTEAVQARIVKAAKAVIAETGGAGIVRGIYSEIGSPLPSHGPVPTGGGLTGGHMGNVRIQLVQSDQREITAAEFVRRWRERVGDVPGVETLTFSSSLGGPSGGAAVAVRLAMSDVPSLQRAATELSGVLGEYSGLKDIDDGVTPGKVQLDLTLKPEGRAAGLTVQDMGRQVRSHFYGAEAVRQQRDRDEIRILVRLPEAERASEYDIESLVLRTPGGGEISLAEAAEIHRGRAYTEIRRVDGRRVTTVTADVEEGQANATEIVGELFETALPALAKRYPGLVYERDGEQKEQRRSMKSLITGFGAALLLIFGLLALPFRSYSQPLIVMGAIPFGVVGAIAGHVIMGFNLSVISVMGLVALAGIVVNDSLVLVDKTNQLRREGLSPHDAVLQGGMSRLRPILLTSLTTFFGLMPMMYEPSVQARFLIPMAISLGWGILFSTAVTLVLVPAMILCLEDLHGLLGGKSSPPEPAPPTGATREPAPVVAWLVGPVSPEAGPPEVSGHG